MHVRGTFVDRVFHSMLVSHWLLVPYLAVHPLVARLYLRALISKRSCHDFNVLAFCLSELSFRPVVHVWMFAGFESLR